RVVPSPSIMIQSSYRAIRTERQTGGNRWMGHEKRMCSAFVDGHRDRCSSEIIYGTGCANLVKASLAGLSASADDDVGDRVIVRERSIAKDSGPNRSPPCGSKIVPSDGPVAANNERTH